MTQVIDGYTIVSARYSNKSNTSVLLETADRGFVAKGMEWTGWTALHDALEVQPAPSHVYTDEARATILAALVDIDMRSIRPLRDGETALVADLASQAAALRQQLHALDEA